MFPELTFPPEARTTSTRLSIVSVSCGSLVTFWIVNVQVYGAPMLVGLTQPLENEMPCCAGFGGGSSASATPMNAKQATNAIAPAGQRSRLKLIEYPHSL